MRRILLAYEGFYKASGGVETHLRDITRKLPHDFDIVTDLFPSDLAYRNRELGRARLIEIGPRNGSITTRPTLQTTRWGFPVQLLGDFRRLRRKARLAGELRWDVYHFHGHNVGSAILRLSRFLSSTRAMPWWFLDSTPRARRLLTVHGLTSQFPHAPWVEELEAMMLSRFDDAVCVDKHLVSIVERIANENSFELCATYIPNCVDTEVFRYCASRQHAGLSVGFAGRAEMSRGIEWLARLARLLPRAIQLHLALAGNRTDLSRIPQPLLTRANTVRVNVPHSQMVDFYKEVDVVVNPVLVRGISRTTLESMAVGRLPIMLSIGDRYPVIHGRTGFLVNTVEEALALLTQLSQNREPLYAISRRAREIVEHEFDCRVVLPSLEKVYEEIASRD